jgi:hypothetical protein
LSAFLLLLFSFFNILISNPTFILQEGTLNPITSGEVTHVKLRSEIRLLSLSLAFLAIFFLCQSWKQDGGIRVDGGRVKVPEEWQNVVGLAMA